MLEAHIELVSYNVCLCRYITPTVLEGIFERWLGENI